LILGLRTNETERLGAERTGRSEIDGLKPGIRLSDGNTAAL